MRKLLAIAFAFAVTAIGGAYAQFADRSASARAVMQACEMSAEWGGSRRNAIAYCACNAGFVSGRMSDREFYIVGRLAPFFGRGDAEGMRAEINRMHRENFSPEEIDAVGQMLIDMNDAAEMSCRNL